MTALMPACSARAMEGGAPISRELISPSSSLRRFWITNNALQRFDALFIGRLREGGKGPPRGRDRLFRIGGTAECDRTDRLLRTGIDDLTCFRYNEATPPSI